jgi:hypothetical protein
MQDFPSNSHKAAQARNKEPQKLERVTSADAQIRRKSLGRQFRETFVSGDAKSAAEYMVTEVVVPAIKDTITDALHAGIDSFFQGNARPRRRSTPSSYSEVGRVDYRGYGSSTTVAARPQSTPTLSQRARTRHDFGEIVIPSRAEANDVIDTMIDILSRHGSVPVADLYTLTGIRSEHTDYKWGWTDLRGAKARRLGDGRYLLDLPDPQPL